jgi:methionyl aminopeptidase
MFVIKNSEQIALMKIAGRITGESLLVARECIRPGVSTKHIEERMRQYIEKCGATPTFLGYGGFPAAACISVNEEVIHGIPSEKRILSEGDIVKIDVGARYRGYTGDSARTFAVGKASEEAMKLISVTEGSFFEAMKVCRAGYRIGDIGAAVENFVISNGFSVVRDYVGHGVGQELHEEPEIPNFGRAGHGARLYPGMTLAIEPMVNAGTHNVKVLKDRWTVVTLDGKLSAHYEHTVQITDAQPILLTDVK